MIYDSAPVKRRIDWVRVERRVVLAMAFAFTFAAGGWVTSVRNQEARLPYLERATNKLEQARAVAGGDPVQVIRCERQARKAAERIADQAVTISNFGALNEPLAAPGPDCPEPKK